MKTIREFLEEQINEQLIQAVVSGRRTLKAVRKTSGVFGYIRKVAGGILRTQIRRGECVSRKVDFIEQGCARCFLCAENTDGELLRISENTEGFTNTFPGSG